MDEFDGQKDPVRERKLLLTVGPVTVAVAGASALVVSTASLLMAAGVAVAVISTGYGAYKWLAARTPGSRHHVSKD
ncbi:MAG: hypothetical protein WC326_00230 [Candidatus Delongbacteria bacterium]